MMLTGNKDVHTGQANASRVPTIKVIVLPGESGYRGHRYFLHALQNGHSQYCKLLQVTSCKEVKAIACQVGQQGNTKLVEKAIKHKHKQGKQQAKHEKKGDKVGRVKKVVASDSDSYLLQFNCHLASQQKSSLPIKHEVGDIVLDTFDVLITAVSFQDKVYIDDEMFTVMMKGKQFALISNVVP
jgi:hypothetical protein